MGQPGATGGCLCGSIRYRVHSDPIRTTVCHCRFCQRATGAAYHVAPVFLEADFEITRGATKTYTHTSDGSRKEIYIRFCENCGTKICLSLERFPGTVGVYGGTFDDPNHFASRSRVTKQIFLSSGRHGTIVAPGIESFWGHAVDGNDEALEGEVFAEPLTLHASTGN